MIQELRAADAAECRAGGLSPEEAIERGLRTSTQVFRELHPNGEPMAIWGYRVECFITSTVRVWMLSYPAADHFKVYFARTALARLSALLEQFPCVECEVWGDHSLARRWLHWMGFVTTGMKWVEDEPFFTMQRERD